MKKFLVFLAIFIFIIDCILITIKLNQNESKRAIHKAKPHYKYSVFLTSDDGPLKGSRYLDRLIREYQVPFTLFLVGKPFSEDRNLRPYLYNYKSNPYTLLGNHSFSHASFRYKRYYKNPSNVVRDFFRNREVLRLDSKFARLPGRNVWVLNQTIYKGEPNALKAAKLLAQYNYHIFGWDYELSYKRGKILQNAYDHYYNIKKLLIEKKTFTPNQLVVLMHDQLFTKEENIRILENLILLLQDDEEIKLKYLNQYKVPFSRRAGL